VAPELRNRRTITTGHRTTWNNRHFCRNKSTKGTLLFKGTIILPLSTDNVSSAFFHQSTQTVSPGLQ